MYNVESGHVATQNKYLIAFTEAQNAIYAKASPTQKRVIVARDVLAALKAKRIEPTTGTYLDVGTERGSRTERGSSLLYLAVANNPLGSFQDLLPQLPKCNVCAKGAIFVCTVLRQNQVTNGELRSLTTTGLFVDKNLSEALKGVFSPAQLCKIENEFECRRVFRGPYAVMGLQRFPAKRRMREIMLNIVANGGWFRPKAVRGRPSPSHEAQD
jgi:hypothetical protein